MRRWLSGVLPLLAMAACRRTRAPQPPASATVPAVVAEVRDVEDAPRANNDLLPGPLNAFGLRMPMASTAGLSSSDMKMFRVEAPMPRVMRYLEHRLDVHNADIHPLAAVIHHATVRGTESNMVVDVGVRDEGDRTLVTVWNRTSPPAPSGAPPGVADGLRAVGIDPATGQYAPELNR
jgi:hypothetical protein